jgi:hypothetical protein
MDGRLSGLNAAETEGHKSLAQSYYAVTTITCSPEILGNCSGAEIGFSRSTTTDRESLL